MGFNVAISSDTVPTSFCPISDTDWSFLVRLLHATINSDPTINYGNAKPTPDKRGLPWFRLNSDGTPDRWYTFQNGLWISRHPMPPNFVGIYSGPSTDIPTFDGGNTNAVTQYDGPFWQLLPNANGRFLAQVGTTASGIVIAAGDQKGDDQHQLVVPELPGHKHYIANVDNPANDDQVTLTAINQVTMRYNATASDRDYILQGTDTPATLGQTGSTGGDNTATAPADSPATPFDLLPPYLGVCFIQRTARLFVTQNA